MITRILQSNLDAHSWTELSRGSVGSVLVMDRGVCRPMDAVFGRPIGTPGRPVLAQEPAALGDGDTALWETQRCVVPILGFSIETRRGKPGVGTWVGDARRPVLAAGLYSVADFGRRARVCFSLLVAASPTPPACRPLYLGVEDPGEWLRMPGCEAMRNLRSMWPVTDAAVAAPRAAARATRVAWS
ncbi:MAG TPA: hypothetical protein VFF91_07065 [Pseudoxanthomonas sp.]|nr:hypothetical protein [Pseudoxanthomonas sp.]